MVLTKVAHNDAKSLKKIGCIFPHHLGGGGVRPWCGKFHKIFIFLTLYPSLNKYKTWTEIEGTSLIGTRKKKEKLFLNFSTDYLEQETTHTLL